MQLLSLFAQSQVFQLPPGDFRNSNLSSNDPVVPILSEIFDLTNRQFLQVPNNYMLGLLDLTPSQMKVIGTGAFLVELMQLGKIPPLELVPLHAKLYLSLGGKPTTSLRPT